MSISLTPRQLELLQYIQAYQVANAGVAPSFDECRHSIGLASKSGIYRLMRGLEDRGHIRRMSRRSRAIEIVTELPVPAVDLTGSPGKHVERAIRPSEALSRTIVVSADVLDALAPHAKRRNVSVNALVRSLLATIADEGMVNSVLDDGDDLGAQH